MGGRILGAAGVLGGLLVLSLGGHVRAAPITTQAPPRGGFATTAFTAAPPVPDKASDAGNGSRPGKPEAEKDAEPTPAEPASTPFAPVLAPPSPPVNPGRLALPFADWINATYPVPVRPAPGRPEGHRGVWVDADTLLWWVRPGPLAIPLVTTTTAPGTPLSGAVSQPQTRILFGGSDIDYGPAVGGRIALGAWLDCEQRFGVEGRGFLLESRAAGLHSASDPAGNPPLYIPAFSTNLNRERPLVVADPVVPRTGSVDLLLRTQLWGAEALGVFNVLRDETVTVDLLGGFRFLSLEENFRLDTRSTLVSTRTETVIRDRFDTLNCFYGAQIGGRGVYAEGPWLLAATARVAFGSTAEAITVTGTTTRGSDKTTPATTRGGFLTQPSNLGRHTADRFGLVPEGELQVGYQFGHGVTALLGYNALYWSQVARVSNQVDPDVNLTQSRVFGTGKLAGVARPVVEGQLTDFWAHGFSVSLQLAY